MVIRDAKLEKNYESIRKCIENSKKTTINQENTELFLQNNNSFFLIVYENEKSNKPLAFAYGVYLPVPENSTPGAFIYALETITGCENKGIGNFLINQLRVYFFYERPISNIVFLCDNNEIGLINAIKRVFGVKINTHSIYMIANDNVDEYGNWKGIPQAKEVVLKLKEDIDVD